MSRSKKNFDQLVQPDGNFRLKFDGQGRISTQIAPENLIPGVQGPEGPEGPIGPQGPQGEKGDTTSAYQPKEAVANEAALPAVGNVEGDVRLVQDTQSFYVWGGSSWANAGSIVPVKGQKGEVGEKGIDGTQGVDGEKGEVGEKGAPGVDIDASDHFTKGESDNLYAKKAGETMTGRLDIVMSDENAAGLRLRGGFAMKAKGEGIGGENLFYSASSNNSVSYNGIITEDGHIANKKYVDDAITSGAPNLSSYLQQGQADLRYILQTGNQVFDGCRITINNPADGKATAFVTDADMYAGNAYRTANNGTINIDGKPKIRLTEFDGSVRIIDVSAENAQKTQGLTLEGNTESGSGLLLKANHPASGYDSIEYYGKVDTDFHLANKKYVDERINAVTDIIPDTSSFATLEDLEAAAPVGDEVLPPILIPEVAFQYSAGQSLTSTTVGPADKKLWGFYNGTSNEWIGNWHAIKVNKSSFEGGQQPVETTESEENRIIEFYDKNTGNLLLKFVASYVKNYGIFTVIGRRYKMIANAGQATGQLTRASMF